MDSYFTAYYQSPRWMWFVETNCRGVGRVAATSGNNNMQLHPNFDLPLS